MLFLRMQAIDLPINFTGWLEEMRLAFDNVGSGPSYKIFCRRLRR